MTQPASHIEYRRAGPADAEAFVRLLSDPEVYGGVLQMPYPSVEEWRKKLEPQATDQSGLHLVAVAGGNIIGSAGLHAVGISPRRRHVAGLGMTVAAEWQGRGIGTELMRRLLDWADNWFGYQRIELTVYTDNERALRLYCKFGFVHEGTHRAYALRNGVYADVHAMARLHPNPPQLPKG
jgi:putative acetyltransferase